jgi:hypothetical protein
LEVRHQERNQLLNPRTVADDPQRRDADPLLEDVVMAALDEVGVMAEVRHEAHPARSEKDRCDQKDVWQVRAAALVGIVADEHVARTNVVSVALRHGADHPLQRAQMQRDVLSLIEQPAGGVEDRRGAVFPLLDIGRDGRPNQHHRHFVRHRAELVADDLRPDRVHSSHRPYPQVPVLVDARLVAWKQEDGRVHLLDHCGPTEARVAREAAP